MSLRGFKGFGKPTYKGDDANLEERIKRLSIENRFIYWTGETYNMRRESLRSNSLRALKEPKVPVPLAAWIKLAARVVDSETGYDPSTVRAGLVLHHDSKPAVYFELEKDKEGNYVAVRTYPNATGGKIEKGTVIIPAAKEEAPAQVEVQGKEIVETAPSKAKRAATRQRVAAKGKPAAKKAG